MGKGAPKYSLESNYYQNRLKTSSEESSSYSERQSCPLIETWISDFISRSSSSKSEVMRQKQAYNKSSIWNLSNISSRGSWPTRHFGGSFWLPIIYMRLRSWLFLEMNALNGDWSPSFVFRSQITHFVEEAQNWYSISTQRPALTWRSNN